MSKNEGELFAMTYKEVKDYAAKVGVDLKYGIKKAYIKAIVDKAGGDYSAPPEEKAPEKPAKAALHQQISNQEAALKTVESDSIGVSTKSEQVSNYAKIQYGIKGIKPDLKAVDTNEKSGLQTAKLMVQLAGDKKQELKETKTVEKTGLGTALLHNDIKGGADLKPAKTAVKCGLSQALLHNEIGSGKDLKPTKTEVKCGLKQALLHNDIQGNNTDLKPSKPTVKCGLAQAKLHIELGKDDHDLKKTETKESPAISPRVKLHYEVKKGTDLKNVETRESPNITVEDAAAKTEAAEPAQGNADS